MVSFGYRASLKSRAQSEAVQAAFARFWASALQYFGCQAWHRQGLVKLTLHNVGCFLRVPRKSQFDLAGSIFHCLLRTRLC